MFDASKVSRLSIPQWEAVYRAEILPGVISIIAVHDISRGFALGGCRMTEYANEAAAMTDVLRLSRGMTFKNAVADLPLGGGKSVIVCDPSVSGEAREKVLTEFGKFVAWVNKDKDQYYTAEDMNTTVGDMHVVKKVTKNIFGTTVDPSPYTSWGTYAGIKFSVDYFAMDMFDGNRNLSGKSVLVQGLGKVGMDLLQHLHREGCKLLISDVREESIREALSKYPNAQVVAPDQVYTTPADVFAPCAKGEVVNKNNVDTLPFKIICGAANNQLQDIKIGQKLHERGVVYCPDYVANMGGVCSIQYLEIEQLDEEKTKEIIERTVRKMLGLTFRAAFKRNISFGESVDHVVKQIVWGEQMEKPDFSNKKLFPLTTTTEPLD